MNTPYQLIKDCYGRLYGRLDACGSCAGAEYCAEAKDPVITDSSVSAEWVTDDCFNPCPEGEESTPRLLCGEALHQFLAQAREPGQAAGIMKWFRILLEMADDHRPAFDVFLTRLWHPRYTEAAIAAELGTTRDHVHYQLRKIKRKFPEVTALWEARDG